MKSLDLKTDKKYVTLIVIQESNNFGDQILTFCDHTSGTFKKYTYVNYEGDWQPFTKKAMLQLYNIIKD